MKGVISAGDFQSLPPSPGWRSIKKCGHVLKGIQELISILENIIEGYANILFLLKILPTDFSIYQWNLPEATVTWCYNSYFLHFFYIY